jgi:hypothetical protein
MAKGPRFKKKSLAEQWTEFELSTGVAATSVVQRTEMRRAFYAGAASFLDAMMRGFTQNTEPEQEDYDYLNSLTDEMEQFGRDIIAGKA